MKDWNTFGANGNGYEGPRLAPPRVTCEYREDGSIIMRSPQKLKAYTRCTGEWLQHWSAQKPDHIFLAERDGDNGWIELTYSEVRERIGKIAQSLLNLELPHRAPVVFLSDNNLDQALITLAAFHVGIPVATLSSAYSLLAKDYTRIENIFKILKPGAVYVSDGEAYQNVINSVKPDCPIFVGKNPESLEGRVITTEELLATDETEAVMEAYRKVSPDTHARYLLTSGSTGDPKCVVHTQRMLCSNQQAIVQCWEFLDDIDIVVLDWLPWSHVFAANHNFNIVLRAGGSLYLDDGRATEKGIHRTIENIKYVKPTLYFNVPRGYEMLVGYLERDRDLARALFGRLEMLFYAAASLPQNVWNRMSAVAATVRKKPLFFCTEWGSTETAPVLTNVHYPLEGPGNIGLPVPGIEIKFVPNEDKMEMRVRGESIFESYLGDESLTQDAFDEEGFYIIGDAGKLADPLRPNKGIVFDGRVSEEFKLSSGTWVYVGALRVAIIDAFSPYIQDCVIAGMDRDYLTLMAFPTQELLDLIEGEPIGNPALHPEVRSVMLERLRAYAEANPSSSRKIERMIIMERPPRLELGEITDKSYINQRRVKALRADRVEMLYATKNIEGRVIQLSEAYE